MVRSVLEEAVALASLSLFLATVAVWAQVLATPSTAIAWPPQNHIQLHP